MRAQSVHDAPPVAARCHSFRTLRSQLPQQGVGRNTAGCADQFGHQRRQIDRRHRRGGMHLRQEPMPRDQGDRSPARLLAEREHRVHRRQAASQDDGRFVRPPTTFMANGPHGSEMKRVRGPAPPLPDRVRRRTMAHGQDDGVGAQGRFPRRCTIQPPDGCARDTADLVEDHGQFRRLARRPWRCPAATRARTRRTTGEEGNRWAAPRRSGAKPIEQNRPGDRAKRSCVRPGHSVGEPIRACYTPALRRWLPAVRPTPP